MKVIHLQSLTLRNWRGEKEHTTEFSPKGITRICGRNGLGKSRHMDAFTWLLFGKDSQDRKDFNLRTIVDGEPLHRVECSVEATLIVDGTPLTIKREYREKWTKPRGQAEEVFSGNVTECTWNGTPVRVNDFKARVAELIDEQVFRMVTSTDYFVSLKPDAQRTALMQLAEVRSDEDIAQGNPEFEALLDMLSGKSLTDFRKEIAAEKRKLKNSLAEVGPRIDQTLKMAPAPQDWEQLTTQLATAKNTVKEIEQGQRSGSEQSEDHKARLKELARQENAIDDEIQSKLSQMDEAKRTQFAKDNEQRTLIEGKLKSLHGTLTDLNILRSQALSKVNEYTNEREYLAAKLDGLRREWKSIREWEYTSDEICPNCGQPLPEDQRAAAREQFAKEKSRRLEANKTSGKTTKEQYDNLCANLDKLSAEAEQAAQQIAQAEGEIAHLYNELKKYPAPVYTRPTYSDLPEDVRQGYELRRAEINRQRKILTSPVACKQDESQYQKAHQEARAKVKQLEDLLATRQVIERAKEEVRRLEDHGQELANRLAELERTEFVAAQFSKARIEDCEKQINSLFRTVRWQLFDRTLDGNEYEVCIPIVDGIPYGSCNTARQINAGIDIASTLATHYGVYAPMFIDRAESVNEFIASNSQMIFLQVTLDNQLTIK